MLPTLRAGGMTECRRVLKVSVLIFESGGGTAVARICLGNADATYSVDLGLIWGSVDILLIRPRGGEGGGCFFKMD